LSVIAAPHPPFSPTARSTCGTRATNESSGHDLDYMLGRCQRCVLDRLRLHIKKRP
jgi:hypothetical protein